MSKYDFLTPGKKMGKPEKEETFINYKDQPNIINDTNAEVKALIDYFNPSNDVDKEKANRMKDNSSRFWFAVYFQDDEQKNEFLQKSGADKLTAGQYINGLELAKLMGIDIQRKESKPPKKFNSFKE